MLLEIHVLYLPIATPVYTSMGTIETKKLISDLIFQIYVVYPIRVVIAKYMLG